MDSKTVCPKCGQSDKIEKVSAVVKSQVQMRGSGIQATALAAALAPPPEPELKVRASGAIMGPQRKSCLGETGFWTNVVLLAGVGLLFTWWGLSDGVFSFTSLFGIALLVFAGFYYYSSQRKLQGAEAVHADATADWKRKMQMWDELYYCYRDDVVFNPRTGRSAAPSNIETLYRS